MGICNSSDEEIYLFSYFDEYEDSSLLGKILEVGVLETVFIISFISNAAIASCIIRYSDMMTISNKFVVNLAVANIALAFSIPVMEYSKHTTSWILGNLTCKLIPYIQFVSSAVLLWTLTFFSSDSYWCVIVPPYRSKITTRLAHIHCYSTWFVAATVFIPVVIWSQQQQTTQHNRFVCSITFPKSESPINLSILGTFPVLTYAFILPIIILVYNYIRTFQKIISTIDARTRLCVTTSGNLNLITILIEDEPKPHGKVSLSEIFNPWSRKTSSGLLLPPNGVYESLSQFEEIRVNRFIKLIRISSLNVVLVLVTWITIILTMILICFNGNKPMEDNNYFLRSNYFLTLMFAFFNIAINILIYGTLADEFKANFFKIFCSLFVQKDSTIENIFTFFYSKNYNSHRSRGNPCHITSVSEV